MATKMDLSLDDIITQTKGSRRGGRGRGVGRGRAGARGRAVGGGTTRNSGGAGAGGGRRGGAGRTTGGSFRRSGNADGVWAHDKFQDTNVGGARKAGVRSAPAGAGGSKITISNLHYGVSDADIMELFGELGTIRYASVHYDRTGRSMGKADVVFDRRSEAQLAIQQYNGVPLDGRSMLITWASAPSTPTTVPSPRGSLNRVQGGRVSRVGGGGGGGRGNATARGGRGAGRGRGRGGRNSNNPKPPTAAELDAELDEYVSQNQK